MVIDAGEAHQDVYSLGKGKAKSSNLFTSSTLEDIAMNRKSRRIRERHVAVDLIAITMGSFIVDAVSRHNWVSGLVAAVLGIALYFVDRIGIENEEGSEE